MTQEECTHDRELTLDDENAAACDDCGAVLNVTPRPGKQLVVGQPSVAPSGSRTLYTPERVNIICQELEAGCSEKAAAMQAGISLGTLHNWIRKYPEFEEQVQLARGRAIGNAERRLFVAKPDLWMLRGPGRTDGNEPWSREEQTINVHQTSHVTVQQAPAFDLSRLSDDEFTQLTAIEGVLRRLVDGAATPALPALEVTATAVGEASGSAGFGEGSESEAPAD